VIKSNEFLQIARAHGDRVARELGMRESRAVAEETYALVRWSNDSRAFELDMDRAEDYRIHASVLRLDSNRPALGQPREPEDFNVYDLEAVLVRRGEAPAELGDYGQGTRPEVDAALANVVRVLEAKAMDLLLGAPDEWHRLGTMMADRVRRFEQGQLEPGT